MHSRQGSEGFSRPRLETLESRLLLSDGPIVINEIHYDPDVKTQPAEFVELYNNGAATVDLSGWRFADGIDFTFPAGASIPAGGYVLVAQNPATVLSKWGRTAYGPYTGQLSNSGERLLLQDRNGLKADEVNYQAGFPWPTVGEAPGYSIELINPSMDNDLGGNWRSGPASASPQSATYIPEASTWRYFKGTAEPSSPMSQWRQLSFTENASWLFGQGPIGYGETYLNTTLSDMNGKYSTVYLRKTFTVDDPSKIANLKLEMRIDDGVNVWINGQPVATRNTTSYELAFNKTASGSSEGLNWSTFTIANPASVLQAGTNIIAIQVLNAALSGSTDCVIDARLTATLNNTTGTTPGRKNSDFAANAAPQMRQVEHTPQQPASGQVVTITTKVTDPEGVSNVTLQYQLVNPGSYIAVTDAAYQTSWTAVTMHDDGLLGDALAGDGVYTVQMPASLQTNRRLVRYRITSTDTTGLSITGPYADDVQQNFAYYVYDGVPAWSGAIQPGSSDSNKARVVTYSADVMGSVPAYQLISKQSAVENSNWKDAYTGEDYPYAGTLVYDGVVYDNIHYRARGGMWRYAMGKNMWKINLNRNHSLQARDNYGRLYDTPWSEVNLGACIQQANAGRRGEQGMFESVGFRLLQLAGVAAENSSFVQLRVVDSATEAGPTQYDGDFWGLYLAVEQVDGNFLDEHDLPDGNVYKMENYTGTLQNQGPTGVTNGSDLSSFISGYTNTTPTEQWWRNEVDVEQYFNYRAIVDLIHHYDIGDGKNYFYYSNPDTDQWSVIPWDLDLTWSDTMYGSGVEPFKAMFGNWNLTAEYRARLREIRDLLFNSDQGFALINEYAAMIDDPAGGLSIVDADRAMWDYNPIMTSSYVNPSKAGTGLFYQSAPTKDFAGMVQQMKNYILTRGAWVDANFAADSNITPTPTVTATGPGTYPINQLTFRSSSPTGTWPFVAMRWRVGEVSDPAAPAFDPNKPRKYEINAVWESPEITTFTPDIAIPSSALEVGHAYRVRVEMKDAMGVWSHWSAPIQFIVGAANDATLSPLRLTELMYNPVSGNDDMEFIELLNASSQPVNAGGATFVSGITYTFPANTVLPAGQRVLLVRFNPATEPAKAQAFFSNYHLGSGGGVTLLGPYTGLLSNGGEAIALNDALGNRIAEFTYSDSGDWPGRSDGLGSSLELINPNLPYADLYDASNWRPSAEYNGTPGSAGAGERGDIQINEVLTHTDPPQSDSVELYNNTDSPINIGGWYLSDSAGNYLKYRIPSGTVIPARGYAVFNESNFNPTPLTPGPNDFSFNGAHGEDVYLVTADPATGAPGRFVDHVSFGGALNGVSFGRSPNGTGDLVPMQRVTLGYDNSYARIGPVIISEVMYHPADLAGGIDDTANEFIELYNPTGSAITLANWFDMNHNGLVESTEKFGWKLDKGVEFIFPVAASIPAHGTIVVVGFDPAIEPDKLAAFRAKYAIGTGVTIVGPWAGKLSNSGESIQLLYPDEPPADEPTFVPYMLVDEVRYSGGSSWPASADGGGASLSRRQWMLLADKASNWSAAAPSPGSASFPTTSPAVTSSTINAGQVQRSHVDSISIVFTSDVGASLTAGDLVVHNLTTGAGVPVSAMSLGYNPATRTATWTFPGLSVGTLSNGEYIATLGTADVADGSGNPLDGDRDGVAGDDFTVTFYRLAGDVNGDRAVDVGDLGMLGAYYGQSSPGIPGDMNGDNTVDVGDLGILGASYGSALAGGAGTLDQLPIDSADPALMLGEAASASAPVRSAPQMAATPASERPVLTLVSPEAPTVPTLQSTVASLTIEDSADVLLAYAVASQETTAMLDLDSILDSLDPLSSLVLQPLGV